MADNTARRRPSRSRSTSTQNNSASNAPNRQSQITARRKPSAAPPSKMKMLFHKMKKAMRVDKTTSLPSDVQNNFAQVKAYRDDLARLVEAIKNVVLPNSQEVMKVGWSLDVCQSTEGNDVYEQFYTALVNYKPLFEKYEGYDKVMRAAWDLAQEERNHQKTTEKTFADVSRFLATDFPALKGLMKQLTLGTTWTSSRAASRPMPPKAADSPKRPRRPVNASRSWESESIRSLRRCSSRRPDTRRVCRPGWTCVACTT